MDGLDQTMRRKSLKERLGLKGMSCCGATFGIGPTTVSVRDEEEEIGGPLDSEIEPIADSQRPIENGSASPCVHQSPAASMNLAAALAAERQFRSSSPPRPNNDEERNPNHGTAGTVPGTPARVSLMRLLEEADGYDGAVKREEEGVVGCDSVCCVCMGRKKGAAFIPCGHTFCRVCSREMWLNRGSCPLCNRLILEILDIY